MSGHDCTQSLSFCLKVGEDQENKVKMLPREIWTHVVSDEIVAIDFKALHSFEFRYRNMT